MEQSEQQLTLIQPAAAQLDYLFRELEASAQPYQRHPKVNSEQPAWSYRISNQKETITGCVLHGAASKHLTTECKYLQQWSHLFNDHARKRARAKHADPHYDLATYTLKPPSFKLKPAV